MSDRKIKETVRETENVAEQALGAMEKLGEDELDGIAGAGNPFADVPRVPTQPIDEDLRGKG